MRSEIEHGEFNDRQISEGERPTQLDPFRWVGGCGVRPDEINDEPLEDTTANQRIDGQPGDDAPLRCLVTRKEK